MSYHAEPSANFQMNLVPALFSSGLLEAPLTLRCLCQWAEPGRQGWQSWQSAQLAADGSVTLAGQQFANLELARVAAKPHPQSTSSAWQFWLYHDTARKAWVPLEHKRAMLVHQQAAAVAKTDTKTETTTELKDSKNHPLRIDAVAYPDSAGQIGLTICPGKQSVGLYGGVWARDLVQDLSCVAKWKPFALISLMEPAEFVTLGVPEFAQVVTDFDFQWRSVPITDMQVPDAHFERQWLALRPDLHAGLRAGGRVVLHCRGGLGRSGVMAARLLIEAGLRPAEAVRQVRLSRVGAIETYAQELYLLTRAWRD